MTIELNPITSGYSTGLINDNFQSLEDYINSKLLNRDGLEVGEANQMENNLDMNSHAILNAITDVNDPGSLITIADADNRYLNIDGDTMEGSLTMNGYPITVRVAIEDSEPARKDELDQERSARQSEDLSIISNYQAADANLQSQISGGTPLEASAFSEISWHGQTVENSVTIPDNQNAWSFGPTMTIAVGQTVTVGSNSFWTIANGEVTA